MMRRLLGNRQLASPKLTALKLADLAKTLMHAMPAVAASATLLASPAFASTTCETEFEAVMQAYRSAGPHQVDLSLTFTSPHPGDNSTRRSIARIVLPDSLALHMQDSRSEASSDAVLIGGKGFAKIDGGWSPLPDTDVKELHALFLDNGFLGEEPRNIQCMGVKELGPKKRGARRMTAYRFEIPGSPKAMAVTLYADPATRQPVSATGSTASQLGGENLEMNITYDPKIKVDAPN